MLSLLTIIFLCRPEHLKENFIVPGVNLKDLNTRHIFYTDVIRFAASYDMGWVTRGTGRTYDSLTGYGTLIGFFSKKVLAYSVMNRKCKKCDLGHPPSDHDCRKNFEGAAKAMEPEAAVRMVLENETLRDCFMELGILVSDNDSSTIAALRDKLTHEIVKLADKNHTTKGVVSQLYNMMKEKRYKELTKASIDYLREGFAYATVQHQGNPTQLQKAVVNIVDHAFNKHDSCDQLGSWCGYSKDTQNYKHRVIGDGFQDEAFYDDLKLLFTTISDKADKYAAGASSNGNESFNSSFVSKAPKARSYGFSPAASIRMALTVKKKMKVKEKC